MNKISKIFASLALMLVVGSIGQSSVGALSPSLFTQTAVSAGKQDACLALKELDPTKACGTGDAKVGSLIRSIINILSIIVGFVSVIMIIISGFKYVTSSGDSGNVASAKTTLIYAIVGLIIVALSQIIVATVLNGTIKSTTPKTSLVTDIVDIDSLRYGG